MLLFQEQQAKLRGLPKDVLLSLAYVTIGAGLSRGFSYLRSIVFARVVTPDQLGLFSLAFGAVSLILPFVIGGSTSLLIRYVSYEGRLTKDLLILALKRPLTIIFLLVLIFSFGNSTVSAIIFGDPQFSTLTTLTAVILIGFTIFSLSVAAFQGSERFDASISLELVNSIISLAAGAALAYFVGASAEWLLVGTVLGFGFASLLTIFLSSKILVKLRQKTTIADMPVLKTEVRRFNSWMTYAAIAYVFVNWGLVNRWLLGRQVSYADAGRMYAILTLVWLPFLIFQLLGTVLQPRMASMVHQGKKKEVRRLANTVFKWSIPVCLLICIIIGTFVYLWAPVLLGEEYVVSYRIVLFLAVSCYYHVVLYLNSLLAIAEGRARAVFLGNLISAGVNLTLTLFLVNKFGMFGVTLALAIGFFCGALALSKINKERTFNYFKGYWLLCILPVFLLLL